MTQQSANKALILYMASLETSGGSSTVPIMTANVLQADFADVQRERAEALKSVMANSKALPIAVGVIVAVRTFLQRATPPEFRVGAGVQELAVPPERFVLFL